MTPKIIRFAAAASLALALSATLHLGLAQAQVAQPPPPPPGYRFRWVEEIEALYPREIPNRLSRPVPGFAAAAAPLAAVPLPGPEFAVDFQHYPTAAEVVTFLQQLEATYPRLVQVTQVGASWQGRPILAIRLGNEATGDPDARPALYLDGQHHAREAISAQVVAYFVWVLLNQYGRDPLIAHLLDTRTVFAIPMVNPDGNEIFLDSWQSMRKTANPTASDDDRDGAFDEDGADGAGFGTFDVFHYFFKDEWVAQHPEDPFVEDWWNHLAGSATYQGVFDDAGQPVPQLDADADTRVNEDPPGGVDANRNYDSHWDTGDTDPRSAIYRGPAPFSEPEARTVRDFVAAHPTIALASTHHSGSDILLYPWGWSSDAALPDVGWLEALARKGSELTEANGFLGSPHAWTARGLYPGSGSTMDWLYEQGILAWMPEVYAASSIAFVERIDVSSIYSTGVSTGAGFNPAPSGMAATLDRWLRWNLYLLAAAPNAGVAGVRVTDAGLEITVANDGLIALDVDAAVQTRDGLHRRTFAGLSGEARTWTIPLADRNKKQQLTISLAARPRVAMASRPPQTVAVEVEVKAGKVQVKRGALEPFRLLADGFGGWYAGAPWDAPPYHIGPAVDVLTAQSNFSAMPTAGVAPLAVQFADTSSGDYLSTLWDFGDGTQSVEPDPIHTYTAAGVYTVSLTIGGYGESDSLVRTEYVTVAAPTPALALVSAARGGRAGGVAFHDEDVLLYDFAVGRWRMLFDGSDVGLHGNDVNGLALLDDGSLLLSLRHDQALPGVGPVSGSDIVRFIPAALGPTTAGAFEMYFDGSDVGLERPGENVDAIDFAPDGRLVISTLGAVRVPGVDGADEDLLAFLPASLGANTAGAWALYLDGSDIGLEQKHEDLWGLSVDAGSGVLYLSMAGKFAAQGVEGDGVDILACTPGALGADSSCSLSLAWRASDAGKAGNSLDALEFAQTLPLGGQVLAASEETAEEVLPEADDGDDDVQDEGVIYLPLISR